MDQNFIRMWLSGFESGLETLDDESRSELLRPCARRCADSGVINIYLNHLENVGYDRDAFYSRLGELTGCDGGIIIPGKKYFISQGEPVTGMSTDAIRYCPAPYS